MSLIQIWWLSNEAKDDKHCTIWLYYYSHQFNFCDSVRTEFDSIKPYIYRVQRTVTFEDYRLRVDFHCCVCMKLKPGLHMIATIAAIAEKNNVQRSQRSQWSYGNHSPAIAAIDDDRWDRKSSFSGIVVVYARPFMPCLYFIFARTHVKITRKWKSIYPRHNSGWWVLRRPSWVVRLAWVVWLLGVVFSCGKV